MSIESADSSSAGPTPDDSSRVAELMAPPESTISLRAPIRTARPSEIASTPMARFPSKRILRTVVRLSSFRFGRFRFGLRYAEAVEWRHLPSTLIGTKPTPSIRPLLKSVFLEYWRFSQLATNAFAVSDGRLFVVMVIGPSRP